MSQFAEVKERVWKGMFKVHV